MPASARGCLALASVSVLASSVLASAAFGVPAEAASAGVVADGPRSAPAPVVEAVLTEATSGLESLFASKRKVRGPKGTVAWTASELLDHDLPSAALSAYRSAAESLSGGCTIPWTLLAGIGRVESDHGRYAGSVLGSDGISRPEIIGVPLDGAGPVAAIADSDDGELDGDDVWDRAVGPMQFIPTTWAMVASDGDDDGVADPHDLDDAALAAASYLCRTSSDLTDPAAVRRAVFSYNQDRYYVRLVLAFAEGYRTGSFVIPSPPPPDEKKKRRPKADRDRPDRGGASPRPGSPGGTPAPSGTPTVPTVPTGPTGPGTPTETPTPNGSPTDTPTDPPTDTPTDTGPDGTTGGPAPSPDPSPEPTDPVVVSTDPTGDPTP